MARTSIIKGPPTPTREFRGIITERLPVMGDAWLVTFSAPEEMVASARPGHFVSVLPHERQVYDPPLRRPFSVYSVDGDRGLMTILVRPYGRGSAWIIERPVGSEIDVLGILGNAFELNPRSTHLLMVAGGVGAAPLLMLSREAVANGMSVTYLLGAQTEKMLLEASEIPSEVEYVVATEDGSAGHQGYVTDLVPGYLQWADQVFACGPTPMFYSLRQQVLANRIGSHPPVQVSVERTMACGVGACLGCMVETRKGMLTSCVDGPVFDMDFLRW
jgi:dihydroorotate dehydrogenase electron transfer subunit